MIGDGEAHLCAGAGGIRRGGRRASKEDCMGGRAALSRGAGAGRAAATKAGGQGMRYTCRILGHETYLFEDDGRWFVEEKDERGRMKP